MLLSLLSLKNYKLFARDGEIGYSTDYFIDQESWMVRYVVVSKSQWFPSNEAVVPLSAFQVGLNTSRAVISLPLMQSQIDSSPKVNVIEPVSRKKERELYRHYGYPAYWTMGYASAVGLYPKSHEMASEGAEVSVKTEEQTNLRSLNEVVGYVIDASDDVFGHIEDLIVDTETWNVRYIVVDVRNWFPSRQVLVAPDWVLRFDWSRDRVVIGLTKESILKSPDYDPERPVNRKLEERLYDFYGRPKHWEGEENAGQLRQEFIP